MEEEASRLNMLQNITLPTLIYKIVFCLLLGFLNLPVHQKCDIQRYTSAVEVPLPLSISAAKIMS